jgi:hypothetical protein
MKKLSLLSVFMLLTACGGGGGGGGSSQPIYPTVSFSSGLEVSSKNEITVSASINDPQSRITNREWELTTTGKDFSYSSTNTSVTFTAPAEAEDQEVTIKLTYTYRTETNTGVSGSSSGSASTSVAIKPVIPDIPLDFGVTAGSQSAFFEWVQSEGVGTYLIYYSEDEGVNTSDDVIDLETGGLGEVWIVKFINDKKYYFAISAKNTAGESGLSNEVFATPVAPVLNFTGNIATGGPTDYSLVDAYGNIGRRGGADSFCVKDNITGLMWIAKIGADEVYGNQGLFDLDDGFTWYDSTNTKLVGDSVVNDFGDRNSNGQNCSFYNEGSDYNCNTEDFAKAVNSKPEGSFHCGVTNWRLPTFDELFSLIDLDGCGEILESDYCLYEIFEEDSDDWNADVIGFWSDDEVLCEGSACNSKARAIRFDDFERGNEAGGLRNSLTYGSKSEERRVRLVSGNIPNPKPEPNLLLEKVNKYVDLTGIEEEISNLENQTGEIWRLPTLKELFYFREELSFLPYSVTRGRGNEYWSSDIWGSDEDGRWCLTKKSSGVYEVGSCNVQYGDDDNGLVLVREGS